jgi:hypothetical protein
VNSTETAAIQGTPLSVQTPPKKGYYRVRDSQGRQGVAFMHPNHTWTLIGGSCQKPLATWEDIK